LQQPPNHHLAELNIGRIKYDLDDPRMADFTNNLGLVNGLAERSPGFVWRYIDDSGNATNTRPYAEARIIVNVSMWESVEATLRLSDRAQAPLWPPRRLVRTFRRTGGRIVVGADRPSADDGRGRHAHRASESARSERLHL
jgi:hypothetical protein